MTAEFDTYASSYKKIINDVSRISGEAYEYFIDLRIKLMAEKMAERLPDQKRLRILDFGCGIGTTAPYLKNAFPQAEIHGVDPSPASIDAARKLELEGVDFVMAGTPSLPFADGYFDLVYTNGTFHHIRSDHHPAAVRELARVLKPFGDLFIFENNPVNPLMMQAMKKNPFDAGVRALPASYINRLLAEEGFRTAPAEYYFFFPKILAALRRLEKYLRPVPLGAQYFVWGRNSTS